MKRITSLSLARFAGMLALFPLCASVVSVSRATPIDSAADHVLGQTDLQSNFTPSFPDANTLRGPTGVAIDGASGRLYVADNGNDRVLSWPSAAQFSDGQAADRVIGQPDFTSDATNIVSASYLHTPSSVAVDKNGNLFVADFANNRVLEYHAALTGDSIADRVYGQPDFVTVTENTNGVSANSLKGPYSAAVDPVSGNLLIADTFNHRVLEYNAPASGDTVADRVFGQASFTTNNPNSGGVSATTLQNPFGIAIDTAGRLFVADTFNFRLLSYDAPIGFRSTIRIPLVLHT